MSNRRTAARPQVQRTALVNEVASRGRVLDLASFLGLDSRVIADVLVEVIDRDPVLKVVPQIKHVT